MLIIYPNKNGISIINPTGDLSIEETARKDTPKGLPYLFINESDAPSDPIFRDAWTADFTDPNGFGIGHNAWQIEQHQAEIALIQRAMAALSQSSESTMVKIERLDFAIVDVQTQTSAENLFEIHRRELEIEAAALEAQKSAWQNHIADLVSKSAQLSQQITNLQSEIQKIEAMEAAQ